MYVCPHSRYRLLNKVCCWDLVTARSEHVRFLGLGRIRGGVQE